MREGTWAGSGVGQQSGGALPCLRTLIAFSKKGMTPFRGMLHRRIGHLRSPSLWQRLLCEARVNEAYCFGCDGAAGGAASVTPFAAPLVIWAFREAVPFTEGEAQHVAAPQLGQTPGLCMGPGGRAPFNSAPTEWGGVGVPPPPPGLGVGIWMPLVNGTGNSPSPGRPTPGVVK